MSVPAGEPTLCYPLREDPELADVVPSDRRKEAIERCTARELRLSPGTGERGVAPVRLEGGIGLLILEGVLIRRVGIDGRFGAELLGEGDLLRPWQAENDSPLLPLETGWSIVHPARLALLDVDFVQHIGRYPELAPCFVARAMQRARYFAVNMAIVHQARVDVRLQMLLWHLAGRWGRVRKDGTLVPLRLTHAVLSDLVAARRPTVSSAISDLARRGLVQAHPDGWLLFGEPPMEVLEVDSTAGQGSQLQRAASNS